MDSKQTAEPAVAREELAGRLFAAFLDLDERGHQFSVRELNALRNVSRWPDARLQRAVEYYEAQLHEK